MAIAEKQEIVREFCYQDTGTLFQALNEQVTAFAKWKTENLIPHLVLSHGFMEWEKLLFKQFPELAWKGKAAETDSSLTFEQRERDFYERFFSRVAGLPALQSLSVEDRFKLREAGWQAYLED